MSAGTLMAATSAPLLGDRRATAPRLVLDTNVCLDLFVFADPQCAALAAALACGALEAVTRADCRDEWRRVLRYAALGLEATRITLLEARFDAGVRLWTSPAAAPTSRLPRCRDPDDQKFLEVACDAGAVALITRDAALLALARRMRRDAGPSILTPAEATHALLPRAGSAPQGAW